MIRFEVNRRSVILEYEPEVTSADWVQRELKTYHEVTISRAFTFKDSDLLGEPVEPAKDEIGEPIFRFHFAELKDGYFRIPGRILGIEVDVLIAESIWLERKLFVAERNIGIFRRIAKVTDDIEIIVGGDREGAIAEDVYRHLLDRFPNTGELNRYANARVETIVGEYFDGLKSARENYEDYLSRRKSSVSGPPLHQDELLQAEMDKFVYVRDTITEWMTNAEAYTERDWQKMIVKIILLIFPKYVAVLENVEIADFYTSPDKTTRRFIDICLVDASGNIDVIEIKKPFGNAMLRRSLYRGNSLPTRELSGSIMQAEKYIFPSLEMGRCRRTRIDAALPR